MLGWEWWKRETYAVALSQWPPPPEEVQRWNELQATILETGFGGMIAAGALALATSDNPAKAGLAVAAVASGAAAILATYGLQPNLTDERADALLRKWLGAFGGLLLLRVAASVALICVGLTLFS